MRRPLGSVSGAMVRVALPVVFASLGVPALPAAAQSAPEEIIVSARKRDEVLQDVPVAITAFTASAIEEADIRSLYDVAELTPGLSFFNPQGEFLAVPVIRGVAPTDIFGETNAAIFVDGIYVSGREGLNFSQLDVERIEVVKGPQSALYGRNAFSGAVNYVTRRPAEAFGVKGEVTAGNEGRQGGQLSVTGPIFGNLRGRAAALYDEFDGSYDNPLGGEDIGGYRYRSLQGSLLWEPAETLSVLGAVYYSNDEVDDSPTTGYPANCQNRVDAAPGVVRWLDFCGKVPSLDEYASFLRRSVGTPSALALAGILDDEAIPKIARALGEDREVTRAHLTVDWDVGFGTLTFLTGYSETKQAALIDGNRSLGDQLPFIRCVFPGDFFCPGAVTDRAFTGLLQVEQEDVTEEFSQEIRFTSPQDQRLRYQGGAYYYDVDQKQRDGGVIATNQGVIGLGPFVGPNMDIIIGDAIFGDWFGPGGDLDPLQRPVILRDTKAWALFAAADFDVNDILTLDTQVRYGEEEKEARAFQWDEDDLTNPEPVLCIQGNEGCGRQKIDNEAWTYRLGARFRISDTWMLYVSRATGEKSGGIDINSVDYTDDTSEILATRFRPEEIVAHEIGIKGSTADGRASFDISLYRNDWSDVVIPQVYETSPVDGRAFEQPEGFNENVGDATIIGWEIIANLNLTERLSLRLTGTHVDATWDDGARQGTFETYPAFRPADCQGPTSPETEPDCQARSGFIGGNQVLRQPEWQASGSLTYEQPAWNDWDFFVRGDVTYQGKVYVGNDNLSYLPAHTYVNLRIGLRSGRYSVEAWGRNIFNDDSPIAAYRDVFFGNSADVYAEGPPVTSTEDLFPLRYTVTHPTLATYGLTARVRFGSEER